MVNEILRGKPARLADTLELVQDGERFWDRSRVRMKGFRRKGERLRIEGPQIPSGVEWIIPEKNPENWKEKTDHRRKTMVCMVWIS